MGLGSKDIKHLLSDGTIDNSHVLSSASDRRRKSYFLMTLKRLGVIEMTREAYYWRWYEKRR